MAVSASGCHDANGGSKCCTSSNQCKKGEGDCTVHDDCQDNLKCGKRNCNDGFPSYYDCCYDPQKGNYCNKTLTLKNIQQ